MKKIIMFATSVLLVAVTNAAAIGWSIGGNNTTYANDAYQFFVIGQKGVTSIDTITALLDAGSSTASYAFGSGKIGSNGNVTVNASTAGQPTLDAGTYTGFFVVFDAAEPASGSANYAVISGATGLTKTIAATAASVSFAGGNVASTLNNADNWKSFGTGGGSVPEPTSGLLLLVGAGMLALRRKQK